MHAIALILHALVFVAPADAYAIPFRRSRINLRENQAIRHHQHVRHIIQLTPASPPIEPPTSFIISLFPPAASSSSALVTSFSSVATSSFSTGVSSILSTDIASSTTVSDFTPSVPSSTLESSTLSISSTASPEPTPPLETPTISSLGATSNPVVPESSTAAPAPETITASSTNTASSEDPSPTLSDPNAPRKYVVAHHMVGNTFPYKLQDWSDDIALAHASGIDGFALNTGRDAHEPDRIADAYEAALQSGLDFKLFLSLDMASRPCSSPEDAQTLRDLVGQYVSHPNQLNYDSRAFVSTFAGESCLFGQGSTVDGWKTQFAQHPEVQGKIYFVPAFFIDPAKFGDFRGVMDGDFNWNSGWPIQVTTDFAKSILNSPPVLAGINNAASVGKSVLSSTISDAAGVSSSLASLEVALSKFIGSTDSDKEHLDGLTALSGGHGVRAEDSKVGAYMAAVSPWFFTHYSPETFNKNFIFLSDQHLYSKRWESLIETRDQFDIVQILTWNDYGESHYVGPIKGAQPNSEAWVDGMDHTGWLDLTNYYATAFKTGEFPKIEKDKIFMWSRTHPSSAQAPDPVGQPANFELSQDTVWAVVMTTAPSTVTLSTSSTSSQAFDVPAGLTKLSVPITAGGTMMGTIARDEKTIVELKPEQFTFQGSPESYNFNAFVASATAE